MKKIVSTIALVSFVASSSGCISLKLADSRPGSKPLAAVCEKRIAVLVFKDRRTVTKLDRQLADAPAVAVSRAIADKFREYCPETVEFIDRQTGAAEEKPSAALTATDKFDFLLTGTLDRFHSEFEDKYQTVRFTGAFVAGLTIPVGLLLLPVLMAGNVDHVSDVDFTISLVEASTGKILWTERSEFRDREKIAYLQADSGRIEDKLNRNLERATSAMFANVSSAYKSRQTSYALKL